MFLRFSLAISMALLLAMVPTRGLAASDDAHGQIDEERFDPVEVIAYQGGAVLTQAELDAAFGKIPEAERLAFIRDGAKVDRLIATLLRRKLVAGAAKEANYDDEPLIAGRLRLEAEKELAEAWLEHLVATAPAADFKALAEEDYLVNQERYRTEVVLDLSHILVGTDQRSEVEAFKLATRLKARLEKDPSLFDELVAEYSDDPTKAENGGRFTEVRKNQMVTAFERAAFKLEEIGAISKPVKTNYGYHIIRLNGRSGGETPPFAEIESQAVERARLEYYESYRRRYLQQLAADPIVIPEGAVEIMVKRHFGEDPDLIPRAAD